MSIFPPKCNLVASSRTFFILDAIQSFNDKSLVTQPSVVNILNAQPFCYASSLTKFL